MGHASGTVSTVGGSRLLLAVGGLYVAVAGAFPLTSAAGDRAVGEVAVFAVLIAASGLAIVSGGSRLPNANVRAETEAVVAVWCLRAIAAMLGIAAVTSLAGGVDDPVAAFLVLPALAGVAGLGIGYHDARAKTRALDAEERQREAERYSAELERYQRIVETVDDGIFVADDDNEFTLVNDAYVELTGYDRERLLGSHTSLVAADETDAEETIGRVERDLDAGNAVGTTYETTLRTASGETIDTEWTVAPLPPQDGGDADLAVVVRDVTERNERERQLERQNERLDSFAGLLAHELRNPVNIGQIYSRRLGPDANAEAVEYVTEAFERIESMIDIMLVITRGREAVGERAPVPLADAAREAWAGAETADATLEVSTDRTVEADETYVQHLFRNLFENAIEYGGADVTVRVGDTSTGFYVADDGTGIPPEEREAIFDPGYTTASSRGGMGLGLTFVKEMADVYEWTCSVTESADGGARFEFENATEVRSVVE